MFALEALNARHGDALLLHYGSEASPKLIVCDAGPSGTYGRLLKGRLDDLKAERSPDEPLPIELLIVSHLDDDHIHGVVDLFEDLAERSDAQEPLPWSVRRLWLNQFDDIVGKADEELERALTVGFDPEGGAGGTGASREAMAVAASVNQGRAVRDQARRLFVELNGPPFRGLVAAGDGGVDAKIGEGLVLSVLAPREAHVEALHRKWDEALRKKRVASQQAIAEAAAYLDNAVFNLSSILILARSGERTMLLTGDARGDHILDALESARVMQRGRLHVDLFKLPHHGSIRNVDRDLFDAVTADHYLISADGRHGNPEVETLEMLVESRGRDEFEIHLTNRIEHVEAFFESVKGSARYRVSYRDDRSASLTVPL